jgi:hypothetical protein
MLTSSRLLVVRAVVVLITRVAVALAVIVSFPHNL